MATILVLTATAMEQDELRQRLCDPVRQHASGRQWHTGTVGPHQAWLVETGIGAVNAAHALTVALQTRRPDCVLQIGVGGAYPAARLELGDLALATEENYGDLGVRTPSGWRPAKLIGIPVLQQDGIEYFNRFPLDELTVGEAARALDAETWDAAVTVARGPFITVQECSGTTDLGVERSVGVGAICENMEGAAAAHLCRLYDVPMIELRSISNQVEDRRPDRWDVPLAARRAQQAALVLLARLEF